MIFFGIIKQPWHIIRTVNIAKDTKRCLIDHIVIALSALNENKIQSMFKYVNGPA